MGNGVTKLSTCFTGGDRCRQKDISVLLPDPLDEGLGHSFCYVRPDPTLLTSSKVHSEEETTMFRTISGASVSANAATPLSTSLYDPYGHIDRAAAFESTTSFPSIPLQPIPKSSGGPTVLGSGPIERGFLSGPIERGFMSGPLDRVGLFSGPLDKPSSDHQFQRSFSHGLALRVGSRKRSLVRILRRAISKTMSRGQNSVVAPIKSSKESDWGIRSEKSRNLQQHNENLTVNSLNFSSEGTIDDDVSLESQNLQWAQGKAGEDRVHVVVSEEHGWLFVGIYDGFNGPDAPDYLLSHLYPAVHRELKGLLWDDPNIESKPQNSSLEVDLERSCGDESCSNQDNNNPCERWWRCEWDRENEDLGRRLKEQINRRSGSDKLPAATNHSEVLQALSQALRKTEEAYLDTADKMLDENPELALMGSCVLVMLMKGEDIYVMNVGDSRAVLGQKSEPDYWLAKIRQDLERINEETMNDLEGCEGDQSSLVPNLSAFQLSVDHSTNVAEEVERIRNEHPDDDTSVTNERVKGSLKVTRAFGAGFLKQPEGDPAQHLVQELLFRAAKKAGMDFHELLEIPQGERRRYHDDVSILVISLEGRMWKSYHIKKKQSTLVALGQHRQSINVRTKFIERVIHPTFSRFAKPIMNGKAYSVVGSEMQTTKVQIGHRRGWGTSRKMEQLVLLEHTTAPILSQEKHCNPMFASYSNTKTGQSPAFVSKIVANFPKDKAFRTCPTNPTGGFPVSICKMIMPNDSSISLFVKYHPADSEVAYLGVEKYVFGFEIAVKYPFGFYGVQETEGTGDFSYNPSSSHPRQRRQIHPLFPPCLSLKLSEKQNVADSSSDKENSPSSSIPSPEIPTSSLQFKDPASFHRSIQHLASNFCLWILCFSSVTLQWTVPRV
ncbi:unnamed protein product, partial [Thlaspi arvense]